MSAPPIEIPAEMYKDFTMNEQIPVMEFYTDSRRFNEGIDWTDEIIELFLEHFTLDNCLTGKQGSEPYPNASFYHALALEKFGDCVKGKDVAVVGTLVPWIEALLVNFGCASVTSVDYNKNKETKYIKTLAYEEYLGEKSKYDAVFSYSSIEHSGLGRYGDPLNPFGDIEAVRAMRDSLKDGGFLFLGVPVGQDALMWNAHRVYGEKRLALLLQGFREIEWVGASREQLNEIPLFYFDCQPLIVLQKV